MSATEESIDVIDAAEMADTAHRVLANHPQRRALAEPRAAQDHWRQLVDLGWLTLAIPGAFDGLEQPYTTLVPLYSELGRVLSPAPLLNSMLLVEMLKGSALAGQFYAGIASGEIVVALHRPHDAPLAASPAGDGLRLDGEIAHCLAPSQATHLVIVIEQAGEPAIAIVETGGAGLEIAPVAFWDPSRALARVTFSGFTVPETALIHVGDPARAAILRAQAHFDLAIAGDAIGGAAQALQDTIDYSITRQQFGRAIGSFQAIKHRCADMRTWLESASALVSHAAQVMSEQGCDTPLAGGARLWATEVYRRIAMDAIQIHGGIGFTAEQDCHLFLQRALLDEHLAGGPSDTAEKLYAPFAEMVAQRFGGLL
ncbi:acyl-CoA dehydrogenase family protein [Hoeflea sp. BAL378]|uniref:acyl-CoA dehydrogenase family protein n=1 Tax=Hoeflea sp. BAL378 TaxID=1547437 RepID=UPI000690AD9E|nr:acyl-CoA dehydrogenase family protein [Hoeflea sp. BAL378]